MTRTSIGDPRQGQGESFPERRLATVLFADIVGYSDFAFASELDELHDVVTRYHALAKAVVEAEGGRLAEYLADGIVAHFGLPFALVDAADRAMRAAYALHRGVRTLQLGDRPFLLRAGIASGEVIAQTGTGDMRITGTAGILAARLQAVAQPGTVYVSQLARRLLQEPDRMSFAGHFALKGMPRTEPVWRLDPADAPHLRHASSSLPFAGDTVELARFYALWTRARQRGCSIPLPQILLNSLQAWIDRSGSARHLAQLAALAGSVFDEDLLAAAADTRPEDLRPDIECLLSAGIFIRAGKGRFAFRSSLLREAARGMLPGSRLATMQNRMLASRNRGRQAFASVTSPSAL